MTEPQYLAIAQIVIAGAVLAGLAIGVLGRRLEHTCPLCKRGFRSAGATAWHRKDGVVEPVCQHADCQAQAATQLEARLRAELMRLTYDEMRAEYQRLRMEATEDPNGNPEDVRGV